MKVLIGVLAGLLLMLQARLWFGDASLFEVVSLKKEIALQQSKVEKLKLRNLTLEAEVQDLKHRLSAIEERARTDLGMIRHGEKFYQYANSSS